MPDNKRQHYVPRCYFKPFSIDGAGNAINVLNIARVMCISKAPLKGQCAKDYLYGEDLVIERALQNFEGACARILRSLQDGDKLTEHDLHELRGFAYLQYSRTEMAFRRMRESHEGLFKEMFEGRQGPAPELDLSDKRMMLESMRLYSETANVVKDLKVCIVKNETRDGFVTSDDPSVFTSRYYAQRLKDNNFGLQSSGALLFLPLTPNLCLICYDGDVYTIPEKNGYQISVRNSADVLALNELQYLKAASNIYFCRWGDRDRVLQEFITSSPSRPESRFRLTVLISDGTNERGDKRYRRATEEERANNQEALVALSALHPAPTRWLSKLQFRHKPRTYSNGSAAGEVRKAAWMDYLGRRGFA